MEGVGCVSDHVTVQNLGAFERDYAQPFIKPYNASARVNITEKQFTIMQNNRDQGCNMCGCQCAAAVARNCQCAAAVAQNCQCAAAVARNYPADTASGVMLTPCQGQNGKTVVCEGVMLTPCQPECRRNREEVATGAAAQA